MFETLPQFASFTHTGAGNGYETVCFRAADAAGAHTAGFLLEGGAAATGRRDPVVGPAPGRCRRSLAHHASRGDRHLARRAPRPHRRGSTRAMVGKRH